MQNMLHRLVDHGFASTANWPVETLRIPGYTGDLLVGEWASS